MRAKHFVWSDMADLANIRIFIPPIPLQGSRVHTINKNQAALERKPARYEQLAENLRGLTTLNLPLGVGCREVINARKHLVLET